jgi:hypothetical protein
MFKNNLLNATNGSIFYWSQKKLFLVLTGFFKADKKSLPAVSAKVQPEGHNQTPERAY